MATSTSMSPSTSSNSSQQQQQKTAQRKKKAARACVHCQKVIGWEGKEEFIRSLIYSFIS